MENGESDYYSRGLATHIDGSPIFKTREDDSNEHKVAEIVEKHWGCDLISLGALAPIDWCAIRGDRLVGVIELKTRTHNSSKFSTVFLNFRKWLALTLAEVGLGVPAIFIVQFTDTLKWIRVSVVSTNEVRVTGCNRIVKSRNDIEPVIEVVVADMKSFKNAR